MSTDVATSQCSEATARALTDTLRQSLAVAWDLMVEAWERRAWAALGYDSWDAYTDAELGEVRLRLPRERRREVVASMSEAGMSTRAIGSALGVADQTVRADQRKVRDFTQPEPDVIDAEIVDDYADLADGTDEQFEAAIAAAEADGDLSRDHLADKIAAELAASDESYAEQATAPKPTTVLGTDGKTYPAAKPAAQRRRPLTDQARDAGWELRKAVDRVERLIDDDRFTSQRNQVATHLRGHLTHAAEVCQDLLGRINSPEGENA